MGGILLGLSMQLRVCNYLEYDQNLTGIVNIGSLCGGWGICFVPIRMRKKVYATLGSELLGRIPARAPGGGWEEGVGFAGGAMGPNYVMTGAKVPVAEQANRRARDYADSIPGGIRLPEKERTRSGRARPLCRFSRGDGMLRYLGVSIDLWANVHFTRIEFYRREV